MKTQLLKLFYAAVLLISCSKNSDQVLEERNQYFVGKTIDFSTNNPVEGSTVYLERAMRKYSSSSISTWNRIIDSTNSNLGGSYLFTFLNNYEQNYSSMYAQKEGYILIGPGPAVEYDSIYKDRDTISKNLYLDKASLLKIHIKDIAPFQSANDLIDILVECKDPVTGAIHFTDWKSFHGTVDTIIVDAFSYKWSPSIKINWQLTTTTGIGNAHGIIIPPFINEFETTDIEINY